MRNLGLDIGEKRIGVAVSDADGILATPLTTINRDDDEMSIEAIFELVQQHQVERIVVGLPYSLDGRAGKEVEKVKAFISKFPECGGISVEMWDERLSTVAAERLMINAGKKRSKRKAQCDAAAAALILQGFLDSLKVSD